MIQYSYYYVPYIQFENYYQYYYNNYQDLNESGEFENEQYIPYLGNNLDEVFQNIQNILNVEK